MKKTSLYLIFILISAMQLFAKDQKTIKVGAFNYYPAIYQDKKGVIKGFYIDALNDLAKKENLKLEFVYGTWSEGLERIKKGEIDMITSAGYTKERAQYMNYTTTPLLTVWSEVYINSKSNIDRIFDLEGKKIAVIKNEINGNFLRQLVGKFNIHCKFVVAADYDEVFLLIAKNKVDAGVVNNIFGAAKSTEYNLRSSSIIINPYDIFFTVSKYNNENLLNILNKHLKSWQYDRNSIYNVSLRKSSHGNVGSIEVFPQWLQKGIIIAVIFILSLIIFIVLLRSRIKIATEKVKQSELLFKIFMENTPAFVYIKDSSLNHIYSNKKVNEISITNIINSAKTIFEKPISDLLEQTDREILQSEKKQVDIQYECTIKGEKIWLHDYKFYLELPNKTPGIGGISFDITKEKETESEILKLKEEAEASENLLRLSTELAHFAAWEYNFETKTMLRSHNHDMLYGIEYQETWSTKSFVKAIHPDDRRMCNMIIEKSIKVNGPDTYKYDYRVIYPDQSIHWINVIGSIEKRNASGEGEMARGFIVDITERKNAEQLLLESEERFKALHNASFGGIAIHDMGIILDCNWGLTEITGYSQEELIGMNGLMLIAPDYRDIVNNNIKRKYEEVYEVMGLRKNNEIYPLKLQARNIPYKGKSVRSVEFRDITEEKKAEQQLKETMIQLVQSNKDLEQFAYVASHDLQEPLRMISSYTQLLERKYKDKIDQNANDYIHYAVDGASRMQKLINDLLEFSRVNSRGKKFESVDVSNVLGQVISNLQLLITENFAIVTNDDLPIINADESQITRVFQNLIGNSIKFKKESENPIIHISCKKLNNYYEFSVRDNGIGMEMQYHDRVFTIFQRLHSIKDYPGTGIGLSINKRIVERHNGTIWFDSKINEGTTFYFTIPV